MKRLAAESLPRRIQARISPLPANEKKAAPEPCVAKLVLAFEAANGGTRASERRHFGPLRVQKPLYPEGPQVCHAIVVHPPGGVAGGDELEISAKLGTGAHSLITNPGAAKWYKSNGRLSRQTILVEARGNAKMEWLPQETILFDACDVTLDTCVSLDTEAVFIGCEILCFGRSASGEGFDSGRVRQRTTIRRSGRLIWFDQGVFAGGDARMSSPLGLAGKPVCATLLAAANSVSAQTIAMMRADAETLGALPGEFGISQLKHVLVARYLGHSSEIAKRLMYGVWHHLRPALLGRAAITPRIWNT
jgi:urease accessory protein